MGALATKFGKTQKVSSTETYAQGVVRRELERKRVLQNEVEIFSQECQNKKKDAPIVCPPKIKEIFEKQGIADGDEMVSAFCVYEKHLNNDLAGENIAYMVKVHELREIVARVGKAKLTDEAIKEKFDKLYDWAFAGVGTVNIPPKLKSKIHKLHHAHWEVDGHEFAGHELPGVFSDAEDVTTSFISGRFNVWLGNTEGLHWKQTFKGKQQEQNSGAKAHFNGQGQNVIAEAAYGDAFAPYMGVMGRGQPHTFGQIGIGSSGMNESIDSIDSALMVSVLGALALLIALCTMILLCCVGCVIGWFGARRFQFGNAKTTTDAMANMDPFYQEARVQSDVV